MYQMKADIGFSVSPDNMTNNKQMNKNQENIPINYLYEKKSISNSE